MSTLLGIEVSGEAASLVALDRQAREVARRRVPIPRPATHWWAGHPEGIHRAVLALIAEGVQEGALRPAEVSAIGIVADPSLVLLDPDFSPIPPRELIWGDRSPSEFVGRPWDALAALIEASPRTAPRIGAVLDLGGFLRFRLTGALGVSVDFAWSGGMARSGGDLASWSVGRLDSVGLSLAQVPPIFPACQRVSVVGEEAIERTGLRRGTWVVGGGDPVNTRLAFAAEPRRGDRVLLLPSGEVPAIGTGEWEVVPPPEGRGRGVRPCPIEGIFFQSTASGPSPEGEGAVLDWLDGTLPDLSRFPDQTRVAPDAGRASSGSALAAGLGLGWWRDPRPLWRKRRPPRTLREWRAERAAVESVEALESESKEDSHD